MDVLLRRMGDRCFYIATGQMSLVQVQCVAVQKKIQPLFKRLFELAVGTCVTIGGIYRDVATEIQVRRDKSGACFAAGGSREPIHTTGVGCTVGRCAA
jgi:hypothetical protein